MKEDSLNETENVISFTECTGILPALPVDDDQADENAARLYAIHAPKKRRKKEWEEGKRGRLL